PLTKPVVCLPFLQHATTRHNSPQQATTRQLSVCLFSNPRFPRQFQTMQAAQPRSSREIAADSFLVSSYLSTVHYPLSLPPPRFLLGSSHHFHLVTHQTGCLSAFFPARHNSPQQATTGHNSPVVCLPFFKPPFSQTIPDNAGSSTEIQSRDRCRFVPRLFLPIHCPLSTFLATTEVPPRLLSS